MSDNTFHPKSKCKAKNPATCPYHGQAETSVADPKVAISRQASEAVERGDTNAYLEAKNREEELDRQSRAAEFAQAGREGETVVDFSEVKAKATRLFQSLTSNIRAATTGKPSMDRLRERYPSLLTEEQIQAGREKLRREKEHALNRQLRDQEVDLIMQGALDPITPEEKEELFNAQLKDSNFSLEGWKPANSTHEYVMRELVKATLDQKEAAFSNADMFSREHEDSINPLNEGEAGGKLSNFDEGWLHTFVVAAEDAKTGSFSDHDNEAAKQEELKRFITRRRDKTLVEDELRPNSFNAGAAQAWEDWLQEI